ncbi:uncharacterized protein LOC114364794 [Ostrinia furnacalis]|uniref:uncharacterized protein LOC114364794 n=1 Tax=Ostrinia furnacalis TaxID=93504 RepID=UPI00103A9CFF|nr:uncharacterized protein LOC114364794 [Ostrinia furnacalis]
MYFGRITAILLICRVESLLACWGGGKQPDDKNHTRYNPNDKKIWGGWDPPGGAKGAWKEYLLTHHQALYGKGAPYDPALHGPKPYGIGIPGWPPNWNGLGYPLTGMEPPPWAYVPKKIGKPSLCYEPPKLGNCNPKKLLTR